MVSSTKPHVRLTAQRSQLVQAEQTNVTLTAPCQENQPTRQLQREARSWLERWLTQLKLNLLNDLPRY